MALAYCEYQAVHFRLVAVYAVVQSDRVQSNQNESVMNECPVLNQ